MDFTLSLAHFCELHGPTSVLCTQALPSSCIQCRPHQRSSSPSKESSPERSSYFPVQSQVWRNRGYAARDIERCQSCRMTIPNETFYDPSPAVDKNRPPIRTREEVHICGDLDSEAEDSSDDGNSFPSLPQSVNFFGNQPSPCLSSSSCHTHSLEYVTAPSPAEVDMFGRLRNAVIRAFTGEELPRGQKAGPFFFGNIDTGFTIGFKFELSDDFARGTRRSYALLALAGHDVQRAFAAATVLWALFEQIALNIISTAQNVSKRSHPDADGTPPEEELEEMMKRPGVSSFLTGRGALGGLGRMMHDRRGGIDQKPTSIADLVENERFFCELHMVFVGILQELGRSFGGMQVRAPEEGEIIEAEKAGVPFSVPSDKTTNGSSKRASEWESHQALPPTPTSMSSTSHAALNGPDIMTGRRQVAV